MNSTIANELKEILLRRRNKVIIDCENDICEIYKNNIIKRINEIDNLRTCCEIENVTENSISIKFNGILLEFINGVLNTYIKENENFEKENNNLIKIIEEETEIIKNKMIFALSLNENLGNLGYSMDEKMFRVVSTLNIKEIDELHKELIPKLKVMVGDNVVYNPLYPNFPEQVINMKNVFLYLNAIVHYWTSGKYIPYTEIENREKTSIEVQYKNISIGNEKDIHELMYNLMNAAEAISEQDIKDLNTYFEKYDNFINNVPEIIRNKENLAITVNLIIKHCKEIPINKIINKFSTVTDVLRLAAVMSDQNATLNKIKFKSFSNSERRLLMELLNNCGNRLEDFYRNRNLWERFCEKIHPNKYKKQYPDLVNDLLGVYKFKRNIKSFKKELKYYETLLELYKINKNNSDSNTEEIKDFNNKDQIQHIDNSKIEERIEQLNTKLIEMSNEVKNYKETHQRYASKVERTLNKKEFNEALNLLSQRPGIFSRRLDELLIKVNDNDIVLKYFEELAPKVSVKVLLSLKGYFQKRFEKLKVRVFLIKGKTSKLYLKKDVKNALDMNICEKICTICDQALINHFSKKPKLNNVYLSEKLKKHLIPLDVRSASSALETYSKENSKSCLGKGNSNKVRLFIWWTNTKKDRVDIDLSAMIFNNDFETLAHVSFTNLKDENFEVYHSGDVVDGGDVNGNGVAEFIDFDPEQIVAGGGRYISASVISYCGINFNKLDNCKFGWMEREDLKSNELFEPKTVRQRLDLNVDKTSTTPVVFDCLTREIIWLDATLNEKGSCICIENSKKPMNAILYYYLCPLKDDMYDLINLHIQARGGKLVNSEDELSDGDIAFVPYLPYKCKEGVKYIRPTDLDIILSEYMTSSLD
eukprot:jgi/Orpsp1_1/1182253/evm.model.c7180000080511.1